VVKQKGTTPDVVVGLDIGGTKLMTALVTSEGTVLDRHRAPAPARDGNAMEATAFDLVEQSLSDARRDGRRIKGIGVGSGGPMSAGGRLLSPLNIPGWVEYPLVDRLRDRFGIPCELDNDAKALALAEGWVGAAQAERNFLAMVVSTGVGGGLVVDGRLLDGATGNGGHIGHVIVNPGGRHCACGARGCLEAEASGTAIASFTGAPPAEAPPDVRAHVGTMVGRAVGSVVTLLDLRLVCVAGSVALGFGDEFFDAARLELERTARLSYSRGARIIPAGCGADGPLIGAGAVYYSRHGLLVPSGSADLGSEATNG